MKELNESAAKVEQLLRDFGGVAGGPAAGGAAEELSRALATGVIGAALQQYLTVALGERAGDTMRHLLVCTCVWNCHAAHAHYCYPSIGHASSSACACQSCQRLRLRAK